MTAPFRSAVVLPALWFALTAIALTVITPPQSCGQSAMLPPGAGGWTRADTVGVYAGKDLFLLIDGGADLFFEYGFVRALSSEYVHAAGVIASTELYEMKNAAAAYGLYTSFTAGTGTAAPIGQEAVLGEGYCIFWKGAYVGMLTAAPFDSIVSPRLLQLAGALEKEIQQTGDPPGLCVLLRKRGFDRRSMVFVRGALAVGNYLREAWASSFPPTEGVVGTFGSSRYLILEYADSVAARDALARAAAEWKTLELRAERDSLQQWMIQERDERVTILRQDGRYVCAVSGERGGVRELAARLREILKGS